MTTASGLPAIRESVQWAVLDAPGGSPALVALAQAAVEHYALNYSKHPPGSPARRGPQDPQSAVHRDRRI
ncbi:hypothetical protein [Streptomyces chartreusis]|uniref:hypothetical protein n=1 Tax=Streptomyces chartreusis TaxID=1969 RepID=UPI0036954507